MLAVVQHQQQAPAPKCRHQGVCQGQARLLEQAQRRRHRLGDPIRIRQRRKIHERSARERRAGFQRVAHQLAGDLDRQPRLTDATRSRKRHQPRGGEPGLDLGNLPLAPQERGQRLRKITPREQKGNRRPFRR